MAWNFESAFLFGISDDYTSGRQSAPAALMTVLYAFLAIVYLFRHTRHKLVRDLTIGPLQFTV